MSSETAELDAPNSPETRIGGSLQRFVGRHSTATLYKGDCLEILRELRGLDCIVTSPPYNQKLDQFKAFWKHTYL